MPTEEQLDQLANLMKEINKGNATNDEVAKLFDTLSRSIVEIRKNLEADIKKVGQKTTETHQKALEIILKAEKRLDLSVQKIDKTSQASLKALKDELTRELQAIRASIPTLPDFKAMIAEVEGKIPTIPDIEMPEVENLVAGRNISIEDRVVTNTNPKITVSSERPKSPEVNDLWVRV